MAAIARDCGRNRCAATLTPGPSQTGDAITPDWCAARALSPRSREATGAARIASSKAIICAVSNSEPIGRTENLALAIVGHRLGRNHGHDVDMLGEPASGLRRDQRRTRATLMRDVDERARRRQIAGAGGGDEEVTRSQRGRRHVAPDRDVAAHVKEAHGEAAHLQPLAPEAEDNDALRLDDLLDQPVEPVFRHGGEHAGKIVQRAFRQWARPSVIGSSSFQSPQPCASPSGRGVTPIRASRSCTQP